MLKRKADLLKATADLMDNTNNVSTQTKTNLWMSGAEDVTFNGTTGDYYSDLKLRSGKNTAYR